MKKLIKFELSAVIDDNELLGWNGDLENKEQFKGLEKELEKRHIFLDKYWIDNIPEDPLLSMKYDSEKNT